MPRFGIPPVTCIRAYEVRSHNLRVKFEVGVGVEFGVRRRSKPLPLILHRAKRWCYRQRWQEATRDLYLNSRHPTTTTAAMRNYAVLRWFRTSLQRAQCAVCSQARLKMRNRRRRSPEAETETETAVIFIIARAQRKSRSGWTRSAPVRPGWGARKSLFLREVVRLRPGWTWSAHVRPGWGAAG
jgi:hypothetical protein